MRRWYQPPKFVLAGTVIGLIIDVGLHPLDPIQRPLIFLAAWMTVFLLAWVVYEFLKWAITGDDFW